MGKYVPSSKSIEILDKILTKKRQGIGVGVTEGDTQIQSQIQSELKGIKKTNNSPQVQNIRNLLDFLKKSDLDESITNKLSQVQSILSNSGITEDKLTKVGSDLPPQTSAPATSPTPTSPTPISPTPISPTPTSPKSRSLSGMFFKSPEKKSREKVEKAEKGFDKSDIEVERAKVELRQAKKNTEMTEGKARSFYEKKEKQAEKKLQEAILKSKEAKRAYDRSRQHEAGIR